MYSSKLNKFGFGSLGKKRLPVRQYPADCITIMFFHCLAKHLVSRFSNQIAD